MSATKFDTRIELGTPENIAFEYQVAGPCLRASAFLIDLFIKGIVIWIAGILLQTLFTGASFTAMQGPLFLLLFVLDWFYGAVFEAVWNGQTPGKRMLKLRVLGAEGTPIAGWQAILRNFLRLVDLMPVYTFGNASAMAGLPCCLLGLVAISCNARFQRLGDLAAGTMVVVEEGNYYSDIVKITDPAVLALAAEVPASFLVRRSLARAISNYMIRRKTLHPERCREIASNVARPVIELCDLPPKTDPDRLMCALYYRTFIAEPGWTDEIARQRSTRPATPQGTDDTLAAFFKQQNR